MAGKWLWHELNTPDVHRAATFYEHLFGWGMNEMPMSNGMYFLWQKDGDGHGGMVHTGGPGLENEPTRWLVYIDSDDVDRDHARVADLGGKALTHVMEVPGTGRWFLAEDPTGAQFAIMQTAPMPAEVKPAKTAKPKAKAKPVAQAKTASKAEPKPKPVKAVAKPKRHVAAKKAATKGRSQRNNKRLD